jgi:hypothetical protein
MTSVFPADKAFTRGARAFGLAAGFDVFAVFAAAFGFALPVSGVFALAAAAGDAFLPFTGSFATSFLGAGAFFFAGSALFLALAGSLSFPKNLPPFNNI